VRNVLKSLGLIICATSIDLLSWWAGSLKHAQRDWLPVLPVGSCNKSSS